ncbi:metal-dependent hydrolase [Novosphingobium sp. HII-3]|nr:metal-dependent hydrolase [Novosphingobium sp. HII-3]
MDNLTHSLVGWAMAEAGLKHRTRKGLAGCILAANMPDIDVFFGWASWAPLAMHRGFTHGLVGGVLIMPPVLALLLWLLDRWQSQPGRQHASGVPMHAGWLVAICYLGALTHPLLDLQNTYAVQLLSPFSSDWFHTDGLFIVSPWMLLMLAAGIARSRSTGRSSPALQSLAIAAAFIATNILVSGQARQSVRERHGNRPERIFAAPEALLFWRRNLAWWDDGRIFHGFYDPLGEGLRMPRSAASYPDNMRDSAVIAATRASPEVIKFLAWSQLPFARVERRGCMAVVTFGDARFSDLPGRSGFTASAEVPVDPECHFR